MIPWSSRAAAAAALTLGCLSLVIGSTQGISPGGATGKICPAIPTLTSKGQFSIFGMIDICGKKLKSCA